MKEYEPIVHKRVLELLEVLLQRGQADFSTMFGYYTSVPSLIAPETRVNHLPIRFDVMADLGRVNYGFLPRSGFLALTNLTFSLGGGTNMTSEGDPDGLSHVMEAGMR